MRDFLLNLRRQFRVQRYRGILEKEGKTEEGIEATRRGGKGQEVNDSTE